MNPITKPLLPPKAGYVEVIDENGKHVYKPVPGNKKEQDVTWESMAAAIREGVNEV